MHSLSRLAALLLLLTPPCAVAQEVQLDPGGQAGLKIVGPDFALGESPAISDSSRLPSGARWLGTEKQVFMMLSPNAGIGSLDLSDPRLQSVRCVTTCVTAPNGEQICFPTCSDDLKDFSLGVLNQ